MKKISVLTLTAVAALSLAACSKPETTNDTTLTETNTVIEDTDANLSAVDGVSTDNTLELDNSVTTNSTTNTF